MQVDKVCGLLCIVLLSLSPIAKGDADSISANGINSSSLGLDGNGISIGQVETLRPGDPTFDTNAAFFHVDVDPAQVFYWNQIHFNANRDFAHEMGNHPINVAGIIISTGTASTGVASAANLYSIGGLIGPTAQDVWSQLAQNAQHLAALGDRPRAINMSINVTSFGQPLDGNTTLPAFIDWSSREHNILYVVAGFQTDATGELPSDNYNGIVVASSAKPMGDTVWREVATHNVPVTGHDGRTLIDLLAPGEDVIQTQGGSTLTTAPHPDGTSVAAPHVTGTVALLQQHAGAQIMAGAPRWDMDAQRHEVMKAVLLNSADKIEDTGNGYRLGMSRTVLDTNGDTWLDSSAYTDPAQPLDIQMGAGHLNAARAFQQFAPGEFDAVSVSGTIVPQIGWDYGNTHETGEIYNIYEFAKPLPAGSYVSITLAWDRIVDLDLDGGTQGVYDIGDTFIEAGDFEEGFNDLDIYLMPAGANDLNDAIASSISPDSNLEHLFFQIADDGMYEFWIFEFESRLANRVPTTRSPGGPTMTRTAPPPSATTTAIRSSMQTTILSGSSLLGISWCRGPARTAMGMASSMPPTTRFGATISVRPVLW